jgi:hypothetical protein
MPVEAKMVGIGIRHYTISYTDKRPEDKHGYKYTQTSADNTKLITGWTIFMPSAPEQRHNVAAIEQTKEKA